MRPEVYFSTMVLNMVLAFLAAIAIAFLVVVLDAQGAITLARGFLLLLIPLPAVAASLAYFFTFVLPDLRALKRELDIDAKLPYALNYISTMAGAGVTLDRVLESLARQPVYGEVSDEAAWIVRDIKLLGKDLPSALTLAIDRSPSLKLQDLLQGTLTTLLSGGDLAEFFRAKSEQFMTENRQEQRQTLESLGLLSEAFVTVVVAAPIMVMVLLSVLTVFGTNAAAILAIGYTAILVLLPAAQAGFIYTIRLIAPER